MPIKQEVVETSEVIETHQPHLLPTPTSEAKNNECILPKKRKAKRVCKIVDKIAMKKKKKRDEKNKTFEWTRNKRFAYEMYKFQCL